MGHLVPHEGNFCQVYAYLLIGTSNFDASFAESRSSWSCRKPA